MVGTSNQSDPGMAIDTNYYTIILLAYYGEWINMDEHGQILHFKVQNLGVCLESSWNAETLRGKYCNPAEIPGYPIDIAFDKKNMFFQIIIKRNETCSKRWRTHVL